MSETDCSQLVELALNQFGDDWHCDNVNFLWIHNHWGETKGKPKPKKWGSQIRNLEQAVRNALTLRAYALTLRAFFPPDIVACISKFLVGPSKRQRSEPAPTASTPSISETTQKPGTSEPAPTASTPGTSEPAPDASANAESEASADASSAPTAPAPARAPAPTPAPPSQHQSQPDPHKRQPDPLELEEHWETLRELQRW